MSNTKWQSQDDQTLLTGITRREAGWRGLLAELLRRHHEALLCRCHAYLKNREDAEDAAQETELRVFRAISRFHGDAAFRTWLFAIADRQCHDIVAKRMRHSLDEHLRALIEIHCDSHKSIANRDDVKSWMSDALAQLPERSRDVLTLRFYKELSLEDVASTLGIGISAAKMRLYRALEQLSQQLSNETKNLYA